MPPWLNTILNILLFIICLSTLIMFHEAGHFSAAKMFRVYCNDFSIGFGKAFFHKKRKKGETYFSLRVFPFGGYVAMASDEGELDESINVPFNRTINGISKWKAGIIMVAGVVMNIIISLVLFYISNQFFPQESIYIESLSVQQDSIAYNAGLRGIDMEAGTGNNISIETDSRSLKNQTRDWYYAYDNTYEVNADPSKAKNYVTFSDGSTRPVLGVIHQIDTNMSNTNISHYLKFYGHLNISEPSEEYPNNVYANYEKKYTPDYSEPIKEGSDELRTIKSVTLNMNYFEAVNDPDAYYCDFCHKNVSSADVMSKEIDGKIYYTHKEHDPDGKMYGSVVRGFKANEHVEPIVLNVINDENGNKVFEESGISFYKETKHLSYTEASTKTFQDFGQGASMIYDALGKLFIGQGWDQMGGIIAIYNQSASVLSDNGVNYFIRYWALISVNLAIFNLLPFPGLDGWQLLVIAIEGVTKKKVPDKAKTIMSYVGLALLMGLMIALLFKDIIAMIV